MDWFFDTAEAVSARLEAWFGSVLSTATDWQLLGKIATVGGVVGFFVLIATAIYTVFVKWPHQKRAFVAEQLRDRDAAEAAQDYRDAAALNRLSNVRLAADHLMRAAELGPSDLAAVVEAGRAAFDAGRLDHARAMVELGAREAALRQDDRWRIYFAIDHGNIDVAAGNLDAALQQQRDARDTAQRLAQNDPGNAGWQRDLAISYGRVAMVDAKAGDQPSALEAMRNGRTIIARLAAASPDNATLPNDLAWFDAQIANLSA